MLFCLSVVVWGLWCAVALALPPLPEGQHWERVEPEVWASSWIVEGELPDGPAGSPLFAFDYDASTAWIFDNDDGGLGESFELWWPETRRFHGLLLQARNGCQETPWTFARERAVGQVEVALEASAQSQRWTRSLDRTLGWQDVLVVSTPDVDHRAPGLRVTVTGIRGGLDPSGTCLADLALFVARSDDHELRSSMPPKLVEDPTLYPSHREPDDWLYPFASARFTEERGKIPPGSAAWDAQVRELSELHAQALALMERAPCYELYQRTESRGLPPPHAFHQFNPWKPYDALVRVTDWVVHDTDQALISSDWSGRSLRADTYQHDVTCYHGEPRTGDAWPRAIAQLDRVRATHVHIDTFIEVDDTLTLRLYDPAGQLRIKASFHTVNDHEPAPRTSGTVMRFLWYDGQIQSVEMQEGVPLDDVVQPPEFSTEAYRGVRTDSVDQPKPIRQRTLTAVVP